MSEEEEKKVTALSDHRNAGMFDGSNAHKPTKDTIKTAMDGAGFGAQTKLIAAKIGISEPTLFKYYQPYLDKGRAEAHFTMGNSVFQKALEGDPTCIKLYVKGQMGWKETSGVEISGKDGEAVKHDHTVSVKGKLNSFLNDIADK